MYDLRMQANHGCNERSKILGLAGQILAGIEIRMLDLIVSPCREGVRAPFVTEPSDRARVIVLSYLERHDSTRFVKGEKAHGERSTRQGVPLARGVRSSFEESFEGGSHLG